MQHFLLQDQLMELWFLPENPDAVDRIMQLLREAQKTIRVAMFTWTRKDFADEIIRAYRRGVDVRVAIDYHSGKGASAEVVHLLSAAGVPTSLSTSNG